MNFTMDFPELPYYLTVSTREEEGTVYVVVNSTIHVNKEVTLPGSYSREYVQDKYRQFRSDILAQIVKRYGLKLEPVKYS